MTDDSAGPDQDEREAVKVHGRLKSFVLKRAASATTARARAERSLKQIVEKGTDLAAEAGSTAGGSMKSLVARGTNLASEGYRRTGARAAVNRAGEKLDEISGKAILDEVRRLVEKQALYNDVLATKLQEALDRIAELEARINQS